MYLNFYIFNVNKKKEFYKYIIGCHIKNNNIIKYKINFN